MSLAISDLRIHVTTTAEIAKRVHIRQIEHVWLCRGVLNSVALPAKMLSSSAICHVESIHIRSTPNCGVRYVAVDTGQRGDSGKFSTTVVIIVK